MDPQLWHHGWISSRENNVKSSNTIRVENLIKMWICSQASSSIITKKRVSIEPNQSVFYLRIRNRQNFSPFLPIQRGVAALIHQRLQVCLSFWKSPDLDLTEITFLNRWNQETHLNIHYFETDKLDGSKENYMHTQRQEKTHSCLLSDCTVLTSRRPWAPSLLSLLALHMAW